MADNQRNGDVDGVLGHFIWTVCFLPGGGSQAFALNNGARYLICCAWLDAIDLHGGVLEGFAFRRVGRKAERLINT